MPTFEVRGLSIRIAEGDGAQAGASAQRVGLVKTKDGWRIETPVQADADARMVESQIAALEALQANRFIQTPDASPAAYGLTNPAMRVSLEGNQRQTLLLGRSVPQQKPAQYYAQLEGNPAIFTVNAALFDALKNAQELLRERHILPFDPAALSAIDIVDEHGARVRLQVLENGSWQVMGEANGTRLEPIRADDNEVARLVGALRTLKAGAFTNDAPTQENLSAYGFDKPLRTVTLSLQNSEPLVLTLGSMQTEEGKLLYARTNRAQGVYQVHPAILMLLSLQSAQYRWRVLEQLPAPAMLTRLSLKDLSAGKVIFEGNPAELPKELDEAKKAAVQQIAAALKNFEVAQYLEKSSDEGCYHDGRLLPWRYELTGSAALSSGADAKTQALAYRFTARQGGTVQGGFSAQSNTAFLLAQPLIDALFTLTDEAPAAAPAAQK